MKRARVFVVGLDGATFDLIRPWAESGILPTFRRLMTEGCWGDLESTIPPFTAPAWSSFATGKNPGKHGLYDFLGRKPGTYEIVPLNAGALRAAPLWRLLGDYDKKVVVLNVPVTYPPQPVNGVMVTGMLTPPRAKTFTYPAEFGEELLGSVPGYAVWPEGVFHPMGREKELLEIVGALTDVRFEATRHLMKRIDWDFFMVVFRGPDLLQHWLWKYMVSGKNHEGLKDGICNIYKQLDRILSKVLELLPQDTSLILMSDHGAGPLDSYIHVNTWLLKEGFLKINRTPGSLVKYGLFRVGLTPRVVYRTLMKLGVGRGVAKTVRYRKSEVRGAMNRFFLSFRDVDWRRTLAYSYGNVGPVFINVKGREPLGRVTPGEPYERVRDEISRRLVALLDPLTGQPLVERVYKKEELYKGDALETAPDIMFMPRDLRHQAFGLLQFTSNHWMEPSFDRSGGHRMNGMFLVWGDGAGKGTIQGARIIDLAPTILALLGCPIPKDMDGTVLREALDESIFEDRAITYVADDKSLEAEPTDLTEDEMKEIRKRLQGLGYV